MTDDPVRNFLRTKGNRYVNVSFSRRMIRLSVNNASAHQVTLIAEPSDPSLEPTWGVSVSWVPRPSP